MILLYKDPKKRKLQIVEIILMILLLPPGLYWAYQSYVSWNNFLKAEAIYTEASEMLHRGDLKEGIAKMDQALLIYPQFYAPWEELAVTHHLMNNHELERDTYERGTLALPQNGDLRRELASVYHELGEHGKELESAQLASSLENRDPLFTSKVLNRAQREASGEISTEAITRPKIEKHEGHQH